MMILGEPGMIFAISLAFLSLAPAQDYIVSAYAGGSPLPTPSVAKEHTIWPPAGLALDSEGNVVFSSGNCIYRLDGEGILTHVAGTSQPGFSGDGGPAVKAQLHQPGAVAVDAENNIYTLDPTNARIRRISADGVITTFTAARYPTALAVHASGDIFFADTWADGVVYKRSRDGITTTIAGGGSESPGDGLSATQVRLRRPTGLAFDHNGDLLIADSADHRVRKVDRDGTITTIAGTGVAGTPQHGQLATEAALKAPGAIGIDSAGVIYFTDRGNYQLIKITPGGALHIVAGAGQSFPADGAQSTDVRFCNDSNVLSALAVGRDDTLFLAACWIQKIGADGVLHNLAGNGIYSFAGDGGPARYAQFFAPVALALDTSGNLFIADSGNSRIRKVDTNGIVSTVAGSGGMPGFRGDGGPATGATLAYPAAVAVGPSGEIFLSDSLNFRIRKVAPDGIITTIAGYGSEASSEDGGPALHSSVQPGALAVDNAGNLFFADSGTRIRKIGLDGILTTVAGTGTRGFSGDGGPAIQATLSLVSSLAISPAGDLVLCDTGNHRIRKVSPDGIISTIAGSGASLVRNDDLRPGDNGPAVNATIFPNGVTVDSAGNVLIATLMGLRRVSTDGVITTIAPGSVPWQSMGDGGLASLAVMRPLAVQAAPDGSIFVLEQGSGDASVRVLRPITR